MKTMTEALKMEVSPSGFPLTIPLAETESSEICSKTSERVEWIFNDSTVPAGGDLPTVSNETELPNASEAETPHEKEIETPLDRSIKTRLRRIGAYVSDLPGIRNLSENAMNRINVVGIAGVFASFPLITTGMNSWVFRSIVKPVSSMDYFSFVSSSGIAGWTLFWTCASVFAVSFLISRGRIFNVGKFSKICLTENSEVAELHVQRNLKTVRNLSKKGRLMRYAEDVAKSLSELESSKSEAFSKVATVNMHSWILAKERTRRLFVEMIRDRWFEAEDRGISTETFGFGKKFALLFFSGEWKKSLNRLLSGKTEEGLVVVRLNRDTGVKFENER